MKHGDIVYYEDRIGRITYIKGDKVQIKTIKAQGCDPIDLWQSIHNYTYRDTVVSECKLVDEQDQVHALLAGLVE